MQPDGQEVVWQEPSRDPSPRFTRRGGLMSGASTRAAKGRRIGDTCPGRGQCLDRGDKRRKCRRRVLGDDAVVACRSGEEIDYSDVEVLYYAMQHRRGRIVFRDDSGLVIATWRRDDEGSIVVSGPPTRFRS